MRPTLQEIPWKTPIFKYAHMIITNTSRAHSLPEVSLRSRSRRGKGPPGSNPPQAPCRTAANHHCNQDLFHPYHLHRHHYHLLSFKATFYLICEGYLVKLLAHTVLQAKVGGHSYTKKIIRVFAFWHN